MHGIPVVGGVLCPYTRRYGGLGSRGQRLVPGDRSNLGCVVVGPSARVAQLLWGTALQWVQVMKPRLLYASPGILTLTSH